MEKTGNLKAGILKRKSKESVKRAEKCRKLPPGRGTKGGPLSNKPAEAY